MKLMSEYKGNLLGHVNTLYRPEDHDIAIELVEALGCTVTDTGAKGDTGSTMFAIHPNPEDTNVQYNVFYMSELSPEHSAIEEFLKKQSDVGGELRNALASYQTKVRTRPFGLPHFALRYRSPAEVEAVAERLLGVSPKLEERIEVRIFRPGDPDAVSQLIQGFVYQDVVVSGSFLLGQLIELQSHSPAA
jgi:hypothetical protein